MGDNNTQSQNYWEAISQDEPLGCPSLDEDIRADVAIVGAGIVGLTAAYELARAGKKVVVLEALQVATQVTARSTAKVTSQHGLSYGELIRNFGEDNARRYAQANQEAIERIASLVAKERMSCGFERKASYIYTADRELASKIEDEAVAAATLGLPARTVKEIPAPVECVTALCFDDQAQFNPRQYLLGLARVVARMARLYENTRVVGVEQEDELQKVSTEGGHTITARHVLVATHLPIVPDGKFFAKAFTFSHSVAAAPLAADKHMDGMFLMAGPPTYSFRVDASGGTPYLIASGPEYETGVPDDLTGSFTKLAAFLQENFDVVAPAFRWTNEDFRSMDGMPFAGRASVSTPRLYVATGFNAWGITNGVAAAHIIADEILQQENPCSELYSATRLKPLAGGTEFIKENLKSARQFVVDHLTPDSSEADEHLGLGKARIVRENGDNIAQYRDMDGKLHEVSAVCTHLGCLVEWNEVDLSWDCPCHGSKFRPDGEVLHGPATSPLEKPDSSPD